MNNRTFAERYPVTFVIETFDFCVVLFSFFVAYWLKFSSLNVKEPFVWATVVIAFVVVFVSFYAGVYDTWRGRSLARRIRIMILAWSLAALCLFSLMFLLKIGVQYSRLWVFYGLGMGLLLAIVSRVLYYQFLKSIRKHGRNQKSVLMLVGDQITARNNFVTNVYLEHGYAITKYLSLDATNLEEALSEVVNDASYREIWIHAPLTMGDRVKQVMYLLRNATAEVRFFPEIDDLRVLNHKVSNVGGRFCIDLSCSPIDGPNQTIKRAEDLVLGFVFFLVALPVGLVIAGLIKLTSPGPVLFKQVRHGLDGKPIRVYKFRSMHVHKENDGSVTQATKGDARLTKLGAFLRRTSLDELPQFYNVLQGRMSIVGPRPHALVHNEYYKDLVESYMRRHKVKPGITGWAQVNGYRGETDTLEKMEKRVQYDLEYIDTWSLWFDIKIIFLTFVKGFVNRNAY